MRKIQRLADVCWEGFTLQHVSNKEVVIPYKVFFILTIIFELFLALLFISSAFIFGSFGYKPNFQYYLGGLILILMLLMTGSMGTVLLLPKKQENRPHASK